MSEIRKHRCAILHHWSFYRWCQWCICLICTTVLYAYSPDINKKLSMCKIRQIWNLCLWIITQFSKHFIVLQFNYGCGWIHVHHLSHFWHHWQRHLLIHGIDQKYALVISTIIWQIDIVFQVSLQKIVCIDMHLFHLSSSRILTITYLRNCQLVLVLCFSNTLVCLYFVYICLLFHRLRHIVNELLNQLNLANN